MRAYLESGCTTTYPELVIELPVEFYVHNTQVGENLLIVWDNCTFTTPVIVQRLEKRLSSSPAYLKLWFEGGKCLSLITFDL